jgi:hypothetical protein
MRRRFGRQTNSVYCCPSHVCGGVYPIRTVCEYSHDETATPAPICRDHAAENAAYMNQRTTALLITVLRQLSAPWFPIQLRH